MIEVRLNKKFKKQYKRCPLKIRKAFDKRVILFIQNKNAKILKNHKLRGKFKNFRSINITGDWRALYKELNNGKVIRFYSLGTHSQLYG